MIILKEFLIVEPDRKTRYEVRRCKQPWHNWVAAQMFHHLVDRPLAPLIQWLREHLSDRHEYADDEWRLPLDVRIELRCYDLGEKNAQVLESWPLNRTTFNQLSRYPDLER